jgi:hypothetical protein
VRHSIIRHTPIASSEGFKTVLPIPSKPSPQKKWPNWPVVLASCFVGLIAADVLMVGIAFAATKKQIAHCRSLDDPTERLACFKRRGMTSESGAESNDPSKTPDAPDQAPTKTSEPETTGAINRLGAAPSQPLCESRDALAVLLAAGLLASAPAATTTVGCRTLPADAQLEVLERDPSGLSFMRIVKVKVTSKSEPDLTAGFTIEIGLRS